MVLTFTKIFPVLMTVGGILLFCYVCLFYMRYSSIMEGKENVYYALQQPTNTD